MAPAFDIVGFDLDGTLLDTSATLTRAVNAALAHGGRPPLHIDEVKPMIGGGARKMLEHGLRATGPVDNAEFAALYQVLLDVYGADLATGTIPYPGMIDALDALAATGSRLAVVTNKFERFAVGLLADLGLLDRFATVIGGDTLGRGQAKPSPAPILAMIRRLGGGRAVFVGDSVYDVLAAREAGIPSIAVSFGFLLQPVDALGADAVINHYAELLPALDRLAARAAVAG